MKAKISLLLVVIFLIGFEMSITSQGKTKSKIQIALILDTSNSMDGLINQAKAQLWKVVNDLALARYNGERPTLEIALYEYGNDRLTASEGYIKMVAQLTTDLDKISEDLFALKTYGGNEYCGQVIQFATRQLNWSKSNKDLKMIFIAGNEAFTQGDVNYVTSCQNSIAKGIIINTIFCGNHQTGINTKWKDGADLADGKYMNIDQNVKVVYINSPYDKDIVKLNSKLNTTYISYGNKGQKMKERQSIQDDNASTFGAVNTVNRAVSKSSGNYKNVKWDLVDAFDEDEARVTKLKKDQLPKEMRGMSKDEMKKHIAKKKKERTRIQKKIQELNKKRNKYVSKKRKEMANDNTLDAVLLKSVRSIAKSKNYKYIEN